MTPILHKLGDAFADRNMFLQVTLGLISMSRQLDDLLAHYGCVPLPGREAEYDPDSGLAFVLGVIAFSRRVQAHAQAVTSANPPVPPRRRAASRRAINPRRLLA